MYGSSDDMAEMTKGIQNTREALKKLYKALKKKNFDLAMEYLLQADLEAVSSFGMMNPDGIKGVDGKMVKAKWQK